MFISLHFEQEVLLKVNFTQKEQKKNNETNFELLRFVSMRIKAFKVRRSYPISHMYSLHCGLPHLESIILLDLNGGKRGNSPREMLRPGDSRDECGWGGGSLRRKGGWGALSRACQVRGPCAYCHLAVSFIVSLLTCHNFEG